MHLAGLPPLNIEYAIPNEATDRTQRYEPVFLDQKHPTRGTTDDCEGGFADDTGVHTWEVETLKQQIQILYNVFTRFGLAMNVDKTKTMCWNWPKDKEYPDEIITINGDQKIENVDVFKYLGVWNSADQVTIGQKELKYRIGCAAGAWASIGIYHLKKLDF